MLKFPKSAALPLWRWPRFASPALAEGDVAAGEKVFKKCKACHMSAKAPSIGLARISTICLAARPDR
jgi:cytochrome c2